ncbi:MAG: hypothetical protein QOJ40_206 [Verrucomicrobiota bacterium]
MSALRIRGLTSMGRATVWLLEFNSDDRLKLRQGLRKLGWFVAVFSGMTVARARKLR